MSLWTGKRRNLFAASGLLPLAGALGSPPDPMLLIYSLFVLAWLARRRLAERTARIRVGMPLKIALAAVAAGWVTEILAWSGSYLARDPQPGLFHPQLAYDLLLASGFYAGNGLAWGLALRRWSFSLPQVFITQGIFGVFVEQSGAVFRQGLAEMPLGLVLWLYVFVVYGSFIGIALLVAGQPENTAPRPRWWHFPLALGMAWMFSYAITAVWALPWQAAGVIPAPQPIWERPLW